MKNKIALFIQKYKKSFLLFIILLSLILRIIGPMIKENIFFHKPFLFYGESFHNSFFNDEIWYDATAMALLQGKGMSIDIKAMQHIAPQGTRSWIQLKQIQNESYYAHKSIAPFYPLFLAFCYFLFGENTLAYFLPQVILSVLTCLFIFFLAKEIFNETVAIFAGFAMAVYPDLIFWTYRLHTENLFIFLLSAGFFFLVKGNLRKNIYLITLSSVFLGLTALTRIVFLPFLTLIVFWQICFFRKNKMFKSSALWAMTLPMGFIVIAWCIRNLIIFGTFTPFTDEVYTFLMKYNTNDLTQAEYYFRLNKTLFSRFIGFFADNPIDHMVTYIKRFLLFWSPFTFEMKTTAKIYKTITWSLIFPLSFFGLFFSKKMFEKSGLLILFIVYYALIHSVVFVDSGLIYRYPVQPFLCIFAGYAVWLIFEKHIFTNSLR